MKVLSLLLLISLTSLAQKKDAYATYFEKGNGNQTADYAEILRFYNQLDADFETIKTQTFGVTDSGEPLRVVIFDTDKTFDYPSKPEKIFLLINNGIHAGEPDGIDATMQLFRDLALQRIAVPKNVVVIAIPVYNIGGLLNRNSTSRANQNGPEAYGFRGNARNFDLNRDFIKSDTRNTQAFVQTFHHFFCPDIFIDNHVSNGADYQYKLTYIMTEPKRLGPTLGEFVKTEMTPAIVKDLQLKKVESTPYVNVWHGTPADGFAQFSDTPRYATGYTSLFNTIGYVVETHMLKPYAERVKVTYDFMVSTINYADKNVTRLKNKRAQNLEQYQAGTSYPIRWTIDSSKLEKITFLGYEAGYKKSEVTTGKRLFYDRNKPFKKEIPFYGTFKPTKEIVIPKAYVIPQGQWKVIELLKENKVAFTRFKQDTIIKVESYHIEDYKTAKTAYEGHYPHNTTSVSTSIVEVPFRQGDYLFQTNQAGVKYLLETLEPEAVDSFFNWNFFDTILQQKEGYSDYVFEDTAAAYLKQHPELQAQLAQKIKEDKAFAENPDAQLDWVYKNSPHYEKAHLQYPVYRIVD
nr:M14 family zinc carboxypeptidase [uncultured Flavobacterium sp.]